MARVLITGGAGFIGFHLARLLAGRGDEVFLVDDLSRGSVDEDLARLLQLPNVSLGEVDLVRTDPASLPGDVERIYHLSAIVGVRNVLTDPERVLRDNVLMLLPVIEAARRQPHLQRLVFASTSEVYAGSLAAFGIPVPTPEATPLAVADLSAPRTSYMLSKIYGEALLRQAGVPMTIVRPHNVFGPRMGMAHVIPELLRKAHEAPDGGELEVASVDHRRTFCYVSDAAEMLDRVAREPACEGQTLNVGAERPEISIGELAERVVAATGKRLTIRAAPATPGSPARRCPDMSKMRALTGYEATVGLDAGIAETYAWYRERAFAVRTP